MLFLSPKHISFPEKDEVVSLNGDLARGRGNVLNVDMHHAYTRCTFLGRRERRNILLKEES